MQGVKTLINGKPPIILSQSQMDALDYLKTIKGRWRNSTEVGQRFTTLVSLERKGIVRRKYASPATMEYEHCRIFFTLLPLPNNPIVTRAQIQ